MAEKQFPDMNFDERVAWARGHILIAVGEGRFRDAVWTVCHQFTLWPEPKRPPQPRLDRLGRMTTARLKKEIKGSRRAPKAKAK